MKTDNKRRKITIIVLLVVMVLGGALLSKRTLNRDEIEEDFRVKVGPDEFPVIFEDGDYENLDKANLIWTVNNLFESFYDYEIIEDIYSYKFNVNGREVETKFYIDELVRRYGPDIRASYYFILEEDGVNQIVLSREFIEAFIEASSKYAEVTDELNNFIERLNRITRINSAEINKLTEAEINSMWFIDHRYEDTRVELKRRGLILRGEEIHYLSTNVFWIEELTEEEIDYLGDETKSMLVGQAVYYKRKDNLPSRVPDDDINLELPSPSNFDPRLHTDPDSEPFIWIPLGTFNFLYDNGQWKIAIFRPGT